MLLEVQKDGFLRLDARGGCELIKSTEMRKTKEVVIETKSQETEKKILQDIYNKALRVVPEKGSLSSFSVYLKKENDLPESIILEVNYKIIDRIKNVDEIMDYSFLHLRSLNASIKKVEKNEGHIIYLNEHPFLFFTFRKANNNKGPILRKLTGKNIFEIFKVLDPLVEYSFC